jgi:uncharacterized protein YhhL (DUF1145 family)
MLGRLMNLFGWLVLLEKLIIPSPRAAFSQVPSFFWSGEGQLLITSVMTPFKEALQIPFYVST